MCPQGNYYLYTSTAFHVKKRTKFTKQKKWEKNNQSKYPNYMHIFIPCWKHLHGLINVYSHRWGAYTPRGQTFDVNRNLLSRRSFAISWKKISLKSNFIHLFYDFIHVYSPREGLTTFGAKFWCQQEHLVTLVICCKFKKISLKSILYNFFHDFIHVYSPGAGTDSPQRTKLWCQHLLQVSKKCLWSLIFIHFFSWFNTCI